MVRPAVKVKMPMSAAGNEVGRERGRQIQKGAQRGLTLIELMVVVTLIAIAVAGVSLSLRDSQATALDREAQRLSTVLEAVRAQSRSSGVALVWVALPGGFAVLPAQAVSGGMGGSVEIAASGLSPWLSADVKASIVNAAGPTQRVIVLGAEPMIAPTTLVLTQGSRQLRVVTDGLRPFRVEAASDVVRTP
jgi:general secretion pathway protein H